MIRHITDNHGAGAYGGPFSDGDALDDGGTDTDVGALTYRHIACECRIGADVDKILTR